MNLLTLQKSPSATHTKVKEEKQESLGSCKSNIGNSMKETPNGKNFTKAYRLRDLGLEAGNGGKGFG